MDPLETAMDSGFNIGMKNNDSHAQDKPLGASEFVTEAYSAKGEKGLKEFYAKWADDYDAEMMDKLNYISPASITAAMMAYLPDKSAKILDIGCGTGLTANELYKEGYRQIFGIDLSTEMIDIASAKGIYEGLAAADINQPLAYETDSFDGIVSSGTFTHGHVGPEPLAEIFRITRPGGIVACTVHQELWQQMQFNLAFENLEKQRTAICLSREFASYYRDREPEGYFCVYQKLSP